MPDTLGIVGRLPSRSEPKPMIIREATLKDAYYLRTRLRNADRKEVEIASGKKPEEIVLYAYHSSVICNVICEREGSKPVGIYGVVPQPGSPNAGIVWMLATPGIRKVSKSFLKAAPGIISGLCIAFPGGIHNIVWANNALHVKWIIAAGFKIGGKTIHNNEIFIYFSKGA